MGLGYVVPSFSVAAQSFMPNVELALYAPVIGAMYFFGAWASAYAMGLRKKANAYSYYCLGLITTALLLLSYFSYVDNELWIRMLILNLTIATVEALVLFSIFKQYQQVDLLNKIVDFSYLFIVLYTFARGFIIYFFLGDIEAEMLVTSVWWLIMLAASIFLSMWFAMVLLGTLVRDIIHQLNDERLKDPLTQLLNRRGFYERAKFKLSQITQSSYCLLMCDIDHFKGINDQYGHLLGDQILKQVSQIIRENVRQHDLVGRFGGEEFILLLQVKSEQQAYDVAERIRSCIETCQSFEVNTSVTASFGLVQVDGEDFMQAIEVADQLLYSAKRSGRNRIGWNYQNLNIPALH